MREKLLLIAYRAYGDWLYTVPVLPFLFEKYDVHLECNNKVYGLVYDDPRFSGITMFDVNASVQHAKANKDFDLDEFTQKRIKNVMEEVKPDKVCDLSNTLERKCMAMRDQEVFFSDVESRRDTLGKISFYDAVFDHVGFKAENINLDGMWFSDEQLKSVVAWREKHKAQFIVMLQAVGSCIQKFYPDTVELVRHIVGKYHNAYVYITGEEGAIEGDFEHPRVINLCGKLPIKQAVLMTKYADYVFGPETGVLVAAGMFGTHKTMLCTSTSIKQACSYHKNDHSLQSSVECSPCHKGIYTEGDCDKIVRQDGDVYSGCVHGFKKKEIYDIIERVYDEKNIYNQEYYTRYQNRSDTETGKKIYDSRWEIIEKYCHGNMTLLDYGCASGAFHTSARNGFVTFGYDINPHSPYHREINGQMDIVTMWDVIEHLHDPKDTIKKLNPKMLFISTPNKGAVEKLEGWRHYRPDEHLWYFDLPSLESLLRECGFKIVEHNFTEGSIRNPERPQDIITVVAERA